MTVLPSSWQDNTWNIRTLEIVEEKQNLVELKKNSFVAKYMDVCAAWL